MTSFGLAGRGWVCVCGGGGGGGGGGREGRGRLFFYIFTVKVAKQNKLFLKSRLCFFFSN